MAWWMRALVVCAVWWGGVVLAADEGDLAAAKQFSLPTLEGKQLRIADYHGQVVLINFWATWCPPCLEEIPDLVAAQERYRRDGLVIIGINYMERADEERLRSFVSGMEINFPVAYGAMSHTGSLAEALGGVWGLPASFLLDRKGRLVYSQMGALSEERLNRIIQPLVK